MALHGFIRRCKFKQTNTQLSIVTKPTERASYYPNDFYFLKGTVMQTENAQVNDRSSVSEVS